MKPLSLVICSLIAFASLAGAQSVVVTNHKVTYKRPKPISEYKKSFVVNYPKVKAATPALSRKIEDALSYQRVLGVNVNEEIKEAQWLEEASFDVKYNKNGALAVDLTIEGSGAYPSGSTKTVVIDTKTGMRVTPAISFNNLSGLASAVKKEQKKEIAKAIDDIKKDPDAGESDPSTLFTDADFKAKDLDWFSISDKGVTFKYDYGFPHVIQALQPAGEFFFSWRQLQPYIKPGSLLSRIAR
jgi:hypothetical protein